MDPPDIATYKKHVEEKVKTLTAILAAVAVGDFSKRVPMPAVEDEFTQLYVGVSTMIDVIHEQVERLQSANQELETRAADAANSLNEAQRLAQMGSFEWDTTENKMKWSEELYDMYGLRPHEVTITYEGFLSRVHPDDKARAKEIFDKSAHDGEDFKFDHRIARTDGQTRVFQTQGKVVRDSTGKPARIVGVSQDITKRVESKSKVHTRDRVLQAIGVFAKDALAQSSWQKNIQSILKLIAESLKLGKISIYHNTTDEQGEIFASQIIEWSAPDIPQRKSYPQFVNFSYKSQGFGAWAKELSQGRPVMGKKEEFAPAEQQYLTSQNIQSLLIAPIFSGNHWWGFLIFEDYQTPRIWDVVEIEAAGTTSDILGAAIEREEVQMKLTLRTMELERLNKLMIGRELKMAELKSEIRTKLEELKKHET